MSQNAAATPPPVKKRRGRPPSTASAAAKAKQINSSNAAAAAAAAAAAVAEEYHMEFEATTVTAATTTTTPAGIKPRRKLPSENLFEAAKQIGYRGVSHQLHAEAIQRFGEQTVQKLLSVCLGDESIFYAYVQTFVAAGCTLENPPPDNFATDHYWMLTPEDRVQMLDEAFAIVDDDAELAKVEPGPFKCKKCGSNRILQTERQLRSGDEAATQFFKCAGCKNRWIVH